MSMPPAFIAWMAPMAISSLLAMTASNGAPVDIQLVIRLAASSRDQFAVCSSMMFSVTPQLPDAITSWMSAVRCTAAWFDNSPIMT